MGKWQKLYPISMGLHLAYFLYSLFPWLFFPLHFGFRLDWNRISGESAVALGFAIWIFAAAARMRAAETARERRRHVLLLVSAFWGALCLVIPPFRESLWFTVGPVIALSWYLSVLDVILQERKRRPFPYAGLGLLATVISLNILLFFPSGAYYQYPYGYVEMNRIVQVDGGQPAGRILGLMISTEPAPLLPYLIAPLRPEIALLAPSAEIDSPERDQRLLRLRESGDVRASAIAQHYLGIARAPMREAGIIVTAVVAGGPVDGKIQAGDILLALGEERITSTAEFRQQLAQFRPSETILLTLRRQDQQERLEITLAGRPENPDVAYMGLGTEDQWRYDVPVPVTVNAADVSGDSWTGVLALAVIDQLTPGGITHGNVVAGTGAIGPDGSINPIGGLPQKVYMAERSGADVIFVPAGQLTEVPPGPRAATIVGVSHLREMVTWLEQHPKVAASQ